MDARELWNTYEGQRTKLGFLVVVYFSLYLCEH